MPIVINAPKVSFEVFDRAMGSLDRLQSKEREGARRLQVKMTWRGTDEVDGRKYYTGVQITLDGEPSAPWACFEDECVGILIDCDQAFSKPDPKAGDNTVEIETPPWER